MKKIFAFAMALIALVACSKEESKEILEPVISSINVSNNGVVYNNKPASISVNFNDNGAEISSVDFYINGELKKTIFSKPYIYEDTYSDLKTGEYVVNIIAKGNNNKQSQSTTNFIFKVNLKDEYQGGIVIKTVDGISGIIAAKNDLLGGVNNKFKYGAYNGNYEAYSMDNGFENTNKFQGKHDANYAAIACLNIELNGYDDWYLPAFEELLLFDDFLEELNIPERSGYKYWSSTGDERDVKKGYIHAFGISYKNPFDIQTLCRVRPCRKF